MLFFIRGDFMHGILSDLVITEIQSVTDIYSEKTAHSERINRERWAVVLKYEGETEYICNGKKYISDNHNPVILPKGCSYNWKCIKAGHFYSMEFMSDLTYDNILSFSIKDDKKLFDSLKDMEYKMLLKKDFYKTECMAAAYNIIVSLEKSVLKKYIPDTKQAKISAAIDYILKNYNTVITNDFLASLTGCSTVYFRKLFYEIYGISPIKYINNLRIAKAKEILNNDYSSVGDVASMLGFNSIYDFSRAFKTHTGSSPSEYAKMIGRYKER